MSIRWTTSEHRGSHRGLHPCAAKRREEWNSGFRLAEPDGRESRCVGEMVRQSRSLCGYPPGGPADIPSGRTTKRRVPRQRENEGDSSHRKHFVSNQVQTDLVRNQSVEVESPHGLADILTQLLPSVALRKNVHRQALCTVSTVGFLRDFEDQFRHAPIIAFPQ